jgi:hypothetical protein
MGSFNRARSEPRPDRCDVSVPVVDVSCTLLVPSCEGRSGWFRLLCDRLGRMSSRVGTDGVRAYELTYPPAVQIRLMAEEMTDKMIANYA